MFDTGRFGANRELRSSILMSMRRPAGDRELVQIVDAAFASAAQRAGEWLVCRPGCTQCCHGAFAINQLDALRLREGMETLREASPTLVETIEGRASQWLVKYGADFPGDLNTGLLGESEEERDRFEEYANDAPCPALDPVTGRCDVYDWRPMTCRVFGPPVRTEVPHGEGAALGHCELCFTGATDDQIAACEMPVPHDFEQQLVNSLDEKGETIVALALLRCEASQMP